MAGTDLASFSAAFKRQFPYPRIERLAYEKQPMAAWMPKRVDFFGTEMQVPIGYGVPTGESHTFADAQAAKNGSPIDRFLITRARYYVLLNIDAETMEASATDKGAFMAARDYETKGAFIKAGQTLGWEIQGTGSGSIGQINAAYVAGNTFVLNDPSQVVRFEKQMRLTASVSDGPPGFERPGAPGYMTVLNIVRTGPLKGTITVDNAAGILGLAALDFLFQKGSFGKAIKGLQAYLPTDAQFVASPVLWSLDRTPDRSRLGGLFHDGSAGGLLAAMENGAAVAATEQVDIDAFWVNYKRFSDISQELGAKVLRGTERLGKFAFDTIEMYAGGKIIKVMADQNVPDDTCWGLKRDTWIWHTLKEAPRFLAKEGGSTELIINPTDDSFEIRIGWRGQLVCRAPGENLRIQLPV